LTWITLERVPLEIYHWEPDIATNLGQIIGVDNANKDYESPSSCIAFYIRNGYEILVDIEWKEDGTTNHIMI
jgi:hypothetical protein